MRQRGGKGERGVVLAWQRARCQRRQLSPSRSCVGLWGLLTASFIGVPGAVEPAQGLVGGPGNRSSAQRCCIKVGKDLSAPFSIATFLMPPIPTQRCCPKERKCT